MPSKWWQRGFTNEVNRWRRDAQHKEKDTQRCGLGLSFQVLIVKKPGNEEATAKMREIAIWLASHNIKVCVLVSGNFGSI